MPLTALLSRAVREEQTPQWRIWEAVQWSSRHCADWVRKACMLIRYSSIIQQICLLSIQPNLFFFCFSHVQKPDNASINSSAASSWILHQRCCQVGLMTSIKVARTSRVEHLDGKKKWITWAVLLPERSLKKTNKPKIKPVHQNGTVSFVDFAWFGGVAQVYWEPIRRHLTGSTGWCFLLCELMLLFVKDRWSTLTFQRLEQRRPDTFCPSSAARGPKDDFFSSFWYK